MSATDAVLAWLDEHESDSIHRLFEWLRIPSVSTDPAYRDEVRRAAAWAGDHLTASGFAVSLREIGDPVGSGHPIVLATTPGDEGYDGPHVLFYGHYDVQPADPLALWASGPFEPVLRDDGPGARIVARGACDDKGQVMTFLEAMRAWKEAAGRIAGGVRMTVLLEGEEESGSANLERFLQDRREEFEACDVCVISDTGMLGRGMPAITYGIRGLTYTEVTLHGADQDLHSGLWGGRAPNPANDLARILGGLWDERGRVTVPGFYDDVRPIEEVERSAWSRLPFSAAEALHAIGLPPEADRGEAGYTALEREWARPTADINGLCAGYIGEGAKTVIASHATAKVSFRLIADQDPASVADAFFDWLRARTPAGCRWTFKRLGDGPPATVPTDSAHLVTARRAIERATGTAPAMIRSGGSIPVAGMLKSILGLDTIFMGFGLPDDRVHSPNEKFELDCFRMGARSHALLAAAWSER